MKHHCLNKPICLFILLFLTAPYHPLCAQTHPAVRFYPLSVGDRWQYHSLYHYHSTHQYSYYTVEAVGDTLPANGKRYVILHSSNNNPMIPRYQRVDSLTAQVFKYDTSNGGAEKLIDSLAASERAWFMSYRAKYSIELFLNKIDSVTKFGEKRERRWHTSFMGDSPGYYYKLTEQFGITEFFNAISLDDQIVIEYTFDTLIYAKIDGKEYGTLLSVAENEILPQTFSLSQNYPNPFNPSTRIDYELPRSAAVTLSIYDMLGREVSTLVDQQKEAGRYSVTWDASAFTAGVYFARMQTGQYTATKKIVLLK